MLVESDASLVQRAQAGDREAFRVLVERHSRGVFRLAWRLTGNEHDADEVVQESFIRAHRQLPAFEARASFSTWMYRIASNCAVDLLRARRRAHDPLETGGEESSRVPAALTTAASQDRVVLSGEIQTRLRDAMTQLSDRERMAFVLRHIDGLSIDEISRQMNLKTNATKHSIFRAVRKLRAALAPFIGTRLPVMNAVWSEATTPKPGA
jgi:RNA polymerase sigma-70 factor, ECF subfamily